MKYNRRGTRVQGSLLIIRHGPDGARYRLKSNALDGLALGDGGGFGWASFSGKATYLEPGWPEPVGNHEFTAYVEDRGEPGAGVDGVWIETRDKDGIVLDGLSLMRPADASAETIEGGNVQVPESANGGKK